MLGLVHVKLAGEEVWRHGVPMATIRSAWAPPGAPSYDNARLAPPLARVVSAHRQACRLPWLGHTAPASAVSRLHSHRFAPREPFQRVPLNRRRSAALPV